MRKYLLNIIGIIALLSVNTFAQDYDTLSTLYGEGGDSFVANDAKRGPDANFNGWSNKGAYQLIVRNYDDGSATRMNVAYLKFDIEGNERFEDGVANEAYIGINVHFSGKMAGDSLKLTVYGVPDDYDEEWTDSTIRFDNAPGIFQDSDLGTCDIDDAEELTTITVPKDSTGWYYSEITEEMDDFINEDENYLLTFIILVEEANKGDEFRFFSAEDTLRAPVLIGGEPMVGIDNIVSNKVKLDQNYPNPFNGSTTLTYSLNKSDNVKLEMYNMVGTKVATLVNENRVSGEHNVTVDMNKLNLSSGIYYAKLNVGSESHTIKMINNK